MGHTLGCVVRTQGDGISPTEPSTVWIGVGDEVRCLPDIAAHALGWAYCLPPRGLHSQRAGT